MYISSPHIHVLSDSYMNIYTGTEVHKYKERKNYSKAFKFLHLAENAALHSSLYSCCCGNKDVYKFPTIVVPKSITHTRHDETHP